MVLLIADDEEIIRNGLLSLTWREAGIKRVLAAENGVQARDILKQETVDILVTDIRMPGLSGLELAEYVKEQCLDVKVILLTGFSDFEYAKKAVKYGVFEYVLKPVKPKELLQSVQEAVWELDTSRRKENLVSKYEDGSGNFHAVEQMTRYFRHCSPDFLEMVKDIAEHYNTDITLNSLSQRYHFNPIYLSRMIKRESGYAFSNILASIRMYHAVQLIRETNMKINMICDSTGFNDSRYFSQIFRKAFFCTPMQYRKQKDQYKQLSLIEILDCMEKKSGDPEENR